MDVYEPIAAAYGTMTAAYEYERWLAVIEAHAHEAGMSGIRLLDVACGSGSSFMPLIDRYDVTACDLSEAMLDQARARAGGRARLERLDMRTLPKLGEFDLVLCLDDSLNHLLDPEGVRDTLAGIAANLADGGVAVFDVNTLLTLRTAFSATGVIEAESGDELVLWRGQGPSDLAPAGVTSARIEVLSLRGEGLYARSIATITERHHPIADVVGMLDAAGLELFRCLGQSPGVRMSPAADELTHWKALFVVRRA